MMCHTNLDTGRILQQAELNYIAYSWRTKKGVNPLRKLEGKGSLASTRTKSRDATRQPASPTVGPLLGQNAVDFPRSGPMKKPPDGDPQR